MKKYCFHTEKLFYNIVVFQLVVNDIIYVFHYEKYRLIWKTGKERGKVI